jgi:hypothetical protein
LQDPATYIASLVYMHSATFSLVLNGAVYWLLINLLQPNRLVTYPAAILLQGYATHFGQLWGVSSSSGHELPSSTLKQAFTSYGAALKWLLSKRGIAIPTKQQQRKSPQREPSCACAPRPPLHVCSIASGCKLVGV